MLADHVRQLKAIELWHAHVHQNHGYFILKQEVQSLSCGMRFEKIFAEILQDGFVAEQLASLVIHHEDVDAFFFLHSRPHIWNWSGVRPPATILVWIG